MNKLRDLANEPPTDEKTESGKLVVPEGAGTFGGVERGVRIGTWGEYLPGIGASGDSSTSPFDYRFGTRDAFLFTLRTGFFARFDGP